MSSEGILKVTWVAAMKLWTGFPDDFFLLVVVLELVPFWMIQYCQYAEG